MIFAASACWRRPLQGRSNARTSGRTIPLGRPTFRTVSEKRPSLPNRGTGNVVGSPIARKLRPSTSVRPGVIAPGSSRSIAQYLRTNDAFWRWRRSARREDGEPIFAAATWTFRRRVAAPPRGAAWTFRRRAAAPPRGATWIFCGEQRPRSSRRRRGCRRVAARGHSGDGPQHRRGVPRTLAAFCS